jgi:hypothetical protein
MWRNLRFRAHTYLGRHPGLLFPLRKLLRRFDGSTVTAESDLLIESFPRSGSTFCYYAFMQAQPRPLSIALHLHVPAHVMRAVRLQVPTLVLIRRPKDAVSSVILREPHLSLKACLERYLIFHRELLRLSADVVMARFEEVIEDFGSTIKRINERYGTSFVLFEHSERNLAIVEAMLAQRHRRLGGGAMSSYLPNKAKEAAKREIDFSRAGRMLERCEAIYEDLSARMEEQ